jgi:hypothetical protein
MLENIAGGMPDIVAEFRPGQKVRFQSGPGGFRGFNVDETVFSIYNCQRADLPCCVWPQACCSLLRVRLLDQKQSDLTFVRG